MPPSTWRMKFSRAVAATNYRPVSFAAQRTSLQLISGKCEHWRNAALTAVHLWRAIAFKPSTKRSRLASVKVNSVVKTAQRTCAHPCPSVGLQARRKVSAEGYGFLLFSSLEPLGQRRQSGFCERGDQGGAFGEYDNILPSTLLTFLHFRINHRPKNPQMDRHGHQRLLNEWSTWM